ncbi:Spindle assembly abnormal protein 4 [Caenorhabditis elegans]|uniref:Spindle assembly abnormal protein 4 n=1 Tax=Caenorhabditis elegans TaxID=6239 RepID=SAS4_CAEEL|nr:Spindle assembly abnormal protein 4 [Caenorhabditis elegans]P34402.2 RecName: Full=Spindle assembly abnormal protein 4 [Caenorhabditis elegans]CAD62434.1 SAS-4 protein [Caenorhabditis elegans]CCD69136.1 Spindle assembly abnormal protein 4 [Caenorhabditis elegans]|eukprot:NP_498828.2 Spindle assembly abnormal protein 4 [Caenorhabditis elegans]
MASDENIGADGEQKPSRPFLRKGQGTARFRMPRNNKTSAGAPPTSELSSASSPSINVPRFSLSNALPNSARTVDSGISNEDETRPPTTASLPMDQPSLSSSPENRLNPAPSVAEEHGHSGQHAEEEEDNDTDEVSAMPSFVPDEPSTLVNSDHELSDDALKYKNAAAEFKAFERRMDSMRSASTITTSLATPSSCAPSNSSEPPTRSTPIMNDLGVGPNNHNWPSSMQELSGISLETPQARPLGSNRINQLVRSEAQTGISLLQHHERPTVTAPLRRNDMMNSSRQNPQNGNVQDENRPEHVYDQPIHVPGSSLDRQKLEIEIRRHRNLNIQLRDTIAHLDYAEESVHTTKRQLEEKISEVNNFKKELIEEFKKCKKGVEEEFEKKFEKIKEDYDELYEKLKRDQRDLERDQKILKKGTGERNKEFTETIATLRDKLRASETKNAQYRQDIRVRDEKLKKKDEEIEKLQKDGNRLKSTLQTLEKRVKQLRTEKERDDKEKEMFAKVAMNRKTSNPVPPVLNQSVPISITSNGPSRHPSSSSLTTFRKPSTSNRERGVSWADEPNEQSLEAVPQEFLMMPVKEMPGKFGKCTIYRDSLGETSKVTDTIANGLLFEYSNGDLRWVNRQNAVNIYISAVDKTVRIDLPTYNISIIHTFQRQVEVLRPGNNITLISIKRREVRTDLIYQNGMYKTEIFNRDGRYVTKDFSNQEVSRKYNPGTHTYRDNQCRYVLVTDYNDFELVEPEFRLRWYQGDPTGLNNQYILKIIGRPECSEKTLRLEVNLSTCEGTLETAEMIGDKRRKTTLFQWKK